MTTAAQKLGDYGITMAQANAWLVANVGDPGYVLSVCSAAGLTNTMVGEIAGYPGAAVSASLVIAFFDLQGLNSRSLDMPTVVSVSGGNAIEGGSVQHTVTLSAPTVAPTDFQLSLNLGGTDLSDFTGYSATQGVALTSATSILVPAGVTSFTLQLDFADDAAIESAESYTLGIGGVQGTGTINDNDAPAASGSLLLPTPIDGFAPTLDLNDRTGDLSTLTLRTKVLDYIADDSKYWALFDPAKYGKPGGGTFTAAELGVSHLGDLPATAETIESLYYGTFLDIALSIDFTEAGAIGTFFMNNLAAIFAHSMPATGQYVALFVDAEADPVGASGQLHTEGSLANTMPTGIIAATNNPWLDNVFWGLLNI